MSQLSLGNAKLSVSRSRSIALAAVASGVLTLAPSPLARAEIVPHVVKPSTVTTHVVESAPPPAPPASSTEPSYTATAPTPPSTSTQGPSSQGQSSSSGGGAQSSSSGLDSSSRGRAFDEPFMGNPFTNPESAHLAAMVDQAINYADAITGALLGDSPTDPSFSNDALPSGSDPSGDPGSAPEWLCNALSWVLVNDSVENGSAGNNSCF